MTSRAKNVHGGRVQFTVRLPPDLYQKVVKEAARDSRTLTGVVEIAVREHMNKRVE